MSISWLKLYQDFFGDRVKCYSDGMVNESWEEISHRRYNYSSSDDVHAVRLLFPKIILEEHPHYKTLVRKGRAIWCYGLKYEGVSAKGYRQVSFHLKGGQKRFLVEERYALCVPSKASVIPRPWRSNSEVFKPFGALFAYESALQLMYTHTTAAIPSYNEFIEQVKADCPFKPGVLVRPRLGYFYPRLDRQEQLIELADTYLQSRSHSFIPVREIKEYLNGTTLCIPPPGFSDFRKWLHTSQEATHPYGLILASPPSSTKSFAERFYRISFGKHIYENIHPFELEIIRHEI
jgi:hypothetical protein